MQQHQQNQPIGLSNNASKDNLQQDNYHIEQQYNYDRGDNNSNLNQGIGGKQRKPPVPSYNKYNRNYRNDHNSKNIDLYNPS